jgi:mannose-6-phosphate isomerase-like protein (cupin superfamily)
VIELSTWFAAYTDERGTLIPVELDDVDFDVRRVFTVVGRAGGASRGDHRLSCREVMILVSGEARVEVGPGPEGPFDERVLTMPGQSVDVAPGQWLRYTLRGSRSVVLVLAAATYETRGER